MIVRPLLGAVVAGDLHGGLREVVDEEFGDEFFAPLPTKYLGRQDGDFRVRVVDELLTDDQSGFDGLPESDLVCQKIPLDRVGQHRQRRIDLVGVDFDRRRQHRGEARARLPLRDEGAQHRDSRVPIVRRIDCSGRQHLHRRRGRHLPAHTQLVAGNQSIVFAVREAHRVAPVSGSGHPSGFPLAGVWVAPVHALLDRQGHRPALFGRQCPRVGNRSCG